MRIAASVWQPRAYFWDGGWIGIGSVVPGAPVRSHAHHAVQVTLSLEQPVRLREGEGEWQQFEGGAIVVPDVTHSFEPWGGLVALLFVDPESREGRWLRSSLSQPITAIPPEQFACCLPGLRNLWERPLDEEEMARLVMSVVSNLCVGPPPTRQFDERILRALELVRASDASRVPLEEVAAKVFLSSSRFAHLFAEEVGLPFRRYVLWHKLTRALRFVSRGSSLSSAAHASGFSDSAHLTRTFYQMFGMSPTAMLGRGDLYEISALFELPYQQV